MAVTQQFIHDVPSDFNVIGNLGASGQVTTDNIAAVKNSTAATAGGVEAVRVGSGALGVVGFYFGSGAPTASAPQGSVYLRTDGSSTSTRLYVATNSAGTWTAVTTAA